MKITQYLVTSTALILAALTCVPSTLAQVPQSAAASTTIVYFTRHGEDVPELVNSDPSFTVKFNNCNSDDSCCVEALNPLGTVRAAALADWFEAKGISL